jgi:hypothetical protein
VTDCQNRAPSSILDAGKSRNPVIQAIPISERYRGLHTVPRTSPRCPRSLAAGLEGHSNGAGGDTGSSYRVGAGFERGCLRVIHLGGLVSCHKMSQLRDALHRRGLHESRRLSLQRDGRRPFPHPQTHEGGAGRIAPGTVTERLIVDTSPPGGRARPGERVLPLPQFAGQWEGFREGANCGRFTVAHRHMRVCRRDLSVHLVT